MPAMAKHHPMNQAVTQFVGNCLGRHIAVKRCEIGGIIGARRGLLGFDKDLLRPETPGIDECSPIIPLARDLLDRSTSRQRIAVSQGGYYA